MWGWERIAIRQGWLGLSCLILLAYIGQNHFYLPDVPVAMSRIYRKKTRDTVLPWLTTVRRLPRIE